MPSWGPWKAHFCPVHLYQLGGVTTTTWLCTADRRSYGFVFLCCFQFPCFVDDLTRASRASKVPSVHPALTREVDRQASRLEEGQSSHSTVCSQHSRGEAESCRGVTWFWPSKMPPMNKGCCPEISSNFLMHANDPQEARRLFSCGCEDPSYPFLRYPDVILGREAGERGSCQGPALTT